MYYCDEAINEYRRARRHPGRLLLRWWSFLIQIRLSNDLIALYFWRSARRVTAELSRVHEDISEKDRDGLDMCKILSSSGETIVVRFLVATLSDMLRMTSKGTISSVTADSRIKETSSVKQTMNILLITRPKLIWTEVVSIYYFKVKLK